MGLGVNLAGVWILRNRAGENLNVQGALFEVVKDALGSLGVIAAGLIIITTGWTYADPIASVLIGLFILPRTWQLLTEAVNVLLEATPARINVAAMKERMQSVDGVAAVHDLHVWTITSGLVAMSGHVVLDDDTGAQDAQGILERIDTLLADEFDIEHTTIQVEHESLQAGEMAP